MAASKPLLLQRLLQALGFHDVGVHRRAMADRADVLRDAVGVDVHAQVHAGLGRTAVAEGDHLAELPARIHMQQRNRRRRWRKRLEQQMQQHRTVLAHRIQHHRGPELGGDFAQDVDAFGLEPVEVRQGLQSHLGVVASAGRPADGRARRRSVWRRPPAPK